MGARKVPDPRPTRSELSQSERRHYLAEFRAARASVLADAEAFHEVLTAVERLGLRLSSKSNGLASIKKFVATIAEAAGSAWERQDGQNVSRFDRIFEIVRSSRNDAMHQGAAARHLSDKCVELATMIEDGLMTTLRRVEDFMIRSPVQAYLFETLASIRRKMLVNSFSYLPVRSGNGWHLLSDAALANYLLDSRSGGERKVRLGQQLDEALKSDKLRLLSARACGPESAIESLLPQLDAHPLLVLEHEQLVGIVTPFDLL